MRNETQQVTFISKISERAECISNVSNETPSIRSSINGSGKKNEDMWSQVEDVKRDLASNKRRKRDSWGVKDFEENCQKVDEGVRSRKSSIIWKETLTAIEEQVHKMHEEEMKAALFEAYPDKMDEIRMLRKWPTKDQSKDYPTLRTWMVSLLNSRQ